MAVVGPSQVASPGSQVTLSGGGSTGDQPLRYRWTQLPGSPPVTLSVNDSVTAHSPTFTAPAAGSIVEFSLVVTDRFNVSSTNTAIARVACGAPPNARFTPDGGLVSGGQTVFFQSTSTDPGGLVLTRHDWSVTGSVASLVTDGGPTAAVTFSNVAFMAPDELASVELRVTNAIGAVSPFFSRTFQVRGANPNNWSIDAGIAMSVVVPQMPPTVTLIGSVAPLSAMPMLSWSCTPSLPLVGTFGLNPQFIAPVIAGPAQTFSCTMTAAAMPPFNPSMLSTTVSVTLRDGALPQVLGTSLRNGRMSPFGYVVRLSEPVQDTNTNGSCSPAINNGPVLRAYGDAALALPRNRPAVGMNCGPFTATLSDLASPSNQAFGAVVSDPAAATVAPEWVGPWVSSIDFEDPRPVIATMGPMPKEEFQRWSPPMPTAPAFELVAREGASLVTSTAIEPFVADAGCAPTCALQVSFNSLAGLAPGGVAPTGHRAFFSGGSLFVAVDTGDGGIEGDLVTRRLPSGIWQSPTVSTGTAFQFDDTWRQVRVNGGSVVVDAWDGPSGTLVGAETVATGQSQVVGASATRNVVALVTGPARALARFRRVSGVTWMAETPPSITDIVRVAAVSSIGPFFETSFGVFERSSSPQLQIGSLDTSNGPLTVATSGVKGWSLASRGSLLVLAVSIAGDVRLLTYDAFVNLTSVADFNGPPRPGFMTPPPPLDLDILCEAAWPQLAFVEDALLVTWQERCSPETRWRIVARAIR